MRTLGVVPARGGSKGIPRKNIKLLRGKPLIAYTLEAAKASGLSRCVVSTDDPEIAAVSRGMGAEVLMRPAHLAEDSTPTLPVLQNVVARLEAGGERFDAVMTLQPTSPFRTSAHIDAALVAFAADPAADSLVSVVQVPHNMTPPSLMLLSADGYLTDFLEAGGKPLRRQDKPVLFARNGAAIYLTRTACLDRFIFGGRLLPFRMSKRDSLDIDDLEDWAIAEALLHAG
jgi:CMP-N,N'-diacetyllegionaminic acid synthase